jgi:hypothetical protein
MDLVISQLYRSFVFLTTPAPVRLAFAFILFPLFLVLQTVEAVPEITKNCANLLTVNGRSRLARSARQYRRTEETLGRAQFTGSYIFAESQLIRVSQEESVQILREAGWKPNTENIWVCGARVSVIHETPNPPTAARRIIVLLHGNPSWSFIWRNVSVFNGHIILGYPRSL